MELDHALEKSHLSLDDIQELLARLGRRAEADEIDRMAGIEGIADFALRLETTDAGSLAGPRIDHHDGPFPRIDDNPWRGYNARERVVHWPGQRPTIHQHLMAEAQHRRQRPRSDLDLFIAALSQQIKEENATLERIDHVLRAKPPSCFRAPPRKWRATQRNCGPNALFATAVSVLDSSVVFMDLSPCDCSEKTRILAGMAQCRLKRRRRIEAHQSRDIPLAGDGRGWPRRRGPRVAARSAFGQAIVCARARNGQLPTGGGVGKAKTPRPARPRRHLASSMRIDCNSRSRSALVFG